MRQSIAGGVWLDSRHRRAPGHRPVTYKDGRRFAHTASNQIESERDTEGITRCRESGDPKSGGRTRGENAL